MSNQHFAIFVQIPNQSQERVMHPGRFVAVNEKTCTAELEETDLAVEPDQEVLIYYEINRRFFRQSARIKTVLRGQQKTVVDLELTGKPALADSRQGYRTSTVGTGMTASIGEERRCPVVNVSDDGIAVITASRHDVGQTVHVEIRHADTACAGRMHAVCVRELEDGRIQYGLLCVDDPGTNGDLIRGLSEINLSVQNLHLRRISRAG